MAPAGCQFMPRYRASDGAPWRVSSTSVVRPSLRASVSAASISRRPMPRRRALLSTISLITSARWPPLAWAARSSCTLPMMPPSVLRAIQRRLPPPLSAAATPSQYAEASSLSSGGRKPTEAPPSTTSFTRAASPGFSDRVVAALSSWTDARSGAAIEGALQLVHVVVVVACHPRRPLLESDAAVRRMDAPALPLLGRQPSQQRERLLPSPAECAQRLVRVLTRVLAIIRPALGVEREGHLAAHAPALAVLRRRPDHEDGGVVGGQHGVKAENAELLDVAQVADDLGRGPAARVGAAPESVGVARGDRGGQLETGALETPDALDHRLPQIFLA